jgi:uncharacterized protein (DUF58 family)
MDYGTVGYTKLDYARRLAACLLWFSQSQRDRVGLVAFDDGIVDFVPPSTRHLPHALHALERVGARATRTGDGGMRGTMAGRPAGSPLRRALRAAGEHLKRRGIAIVVSDLYESPDDVIAAAGHLRRRGGDVTVFHLLDPAELGFPFGDASSFEDLETGERIPVVPDRLREEYRERVAAHGAELRRRLGADGIDYAFFDTSMPLDHALYAYLAGRQRRRAGRGTGTGRR